MRAAQVKEREAKRSLQILLAKCRANTSAAVDVLVEVMSSSSHAPSRVAAAKAIIEFGNGKAPEQVRMERIFTPEEIKVMAEAIILERSQEAAIDGGSLGGSALAPKR